MIVTLLGTGTSTGVPMVSCRCPVCTSADPRDKRMRSACLVDVDAERILIDCGPDFRNQMLCQSFRPLSAILITHNHYDHIGGLDDARPQQVYGEVDVFAQQTVAEYLRKRMNYCFGDARYPGAPALALHTITPYHDFRIGGVSVTPIMVYHGKLPIVGFRIGSFAYITDMSTMPQRSLQALQGVTHMVINGLRHKPHPTHQTIAEATSIAKSLRVKQAYLTHLSHDAGLHAIESANLPEGIAMGYDGLTFEL